MSIRILVVDDFAPIHRLLRRVANGLELDLDLSFAFDGVEALDLMHTSSAAFELVLTNMMMPRCTGLELLRRIRSEGHDVPVVVMTGCFLGTAEELNEFDAFILKPFTRDVFLASIERWLDLP